MARKNHQRAYSGESPVYVHRGVTARLGDERPVYSTDGEESQRAPSDRTMSEYMIANERMATPDRHGHHDKTGRTSASSRRYDDDGSEIYVTSAAYKAPSELSHAPSHYSYRSYRSGAPSEVSTVKTKTSRKGGVVVETMSAPNPFCPNTKGICCLMLLINLGLILVTLGFVIVIQFFEPVFVWALGIVFLIFGFLTLIGSLIYCVLVCKDTKSPKDVSPQDLYWTHHWQKNIGSPEIHYKTEDKYADDRYSDRYSVSKYSDRHSDRY